MIISDKNCIQKLHLLFNDGITGVTQFTRRNHFIGTNQYKVLDWNVALHVYFFRCKVSERHTQLPLPALCIRKTYPVTTSSIVYQKDIPSYHFQHCVSERHTQLPLPALCIRKTYPVTTSSIVYQKDIPSYHFQHCVSERHTQLPLPALCIRKTYPVTTSSIEIKLLNPVGEGITPVECVSGQVYTETIRPL